MAIVSCARFSRQLILRTLFQWFILSHCHQTWEWQYQFCEKSETAIFAMNVERSDDAINADKSSAPVVLEQSNQSVGETPLMSECASQSGVQGDVENQALMMAVVGASPCPSLGLGSSSSGQGDGATNNESESEATRQSDITQDMRNDSILSNNVTVRKSMRTANEDAESNDDGSTQPNPTAVLSTKSNEVIVDSMAASSPKELQLPEEVTTELNSPSNMPVSPLSPDILRLSGGFEGAVDTIYAAPIVNEEIAGLSPIMVNRESDITNVRMSPSELRVGAVEIMVTHPEVHSPPATRLAPSPQSNEEHQPSHGERTLVVQNNSSLHDADDRDPELASASAKVVDERETPKYAAETIVAHSEEEVRTSTSTRVDRSQSGEENWESQDELVASTHDSGCGETDTESVAKDENDAKEATQAAAETEEPSNGDLASGVSSATSVDNDALEDADDEGKEHESVKSSTDVMASYSRQENSFASRSVEVAQDAGVSKIEDESSEQPVASILSETIEEGTVETELCLGSTQQIESPAADASIGDVESTQKEPTDTSIDDIEDNQKEPTHTYRDLTSAKKNLDASSMAFIERLRGAAHRRKLRVARSRDSLAAKEREHLLSIASANERRLIMAPKEASLKADSLSAKTTPAIEPYKPFKARPVPSTTGYLGSGGQVGVPKVEKKPTTTPFSPLLGVRRPRKEQIPALDSPPHHAPRQSASRLVSMVAKSLTPKKARGHSLPFKARPAPPTTGIQGHGGQVGVPKVAKRPATVPVSPCLGNRRSSLPTVSKPNPDGPRLSFVAPKKHDSRLKKDATSAKPFGRILSGSEVRGVVCAVWE